MRRAVRFYNWNVPPDMEIAAVLHQDDCRWVTRLRLQEGEGMEAIAGLWQIFDSEAEATRNAERFRLEHHNINWRITDRPICCRW